MQNFAIAKDADQASMASQAMDVRQYSDVFQALSARLACSATPSCKSWLVRLVGSVRASSKHVHRIHKYERGCR
jgi:hypothetical protein